MKISRILVILLLGMFCGSAHMAFAAKDLGMCPVMQDQPAKEKFFADYQGKRYNFCCNRCVKKFKQNPEKYVHAS